MATSKTPAGVTGYTAGKAAAVVSQFPLITHVYGYAGPPSDHQNRRCVDYMIMNRALTRAEQIALGDAIVAWHWANRKRVGLVLVIWNRQIIRNYGKTQGGRYYPAGTPAPYNASVNRFWTNPHTDHPHVEYDGSAMGGIVLPPPAPSWSGLAKDYPGAGAFVLGQDHPAVTMLDRQLIAHGYTASNDGDGYQAGPRFTQHTLENVRAFQQAQGWTGADADGYAGPETWRRLMLEPPKPAEDDKQEEQTVAEFVVAYGNALRKTDTMIGRLKWALRAGNVAKHFLSVGPDVILAVEMAEDSAADIAKRLGAGWSYWRFRYVVVFWRSVVFERRGDAENQVEYRDNQNRVLLSLPLYHRGSGEQVVFDVTHLENDGDTGTDGHKARYVEASHMAELTKRGRRVFGSDLNSTTRSTAKADARQRQKPRPILRAAGWSGFLTEVVRITLRTHHGGKGKAPAGTGADAIDELGWRGGLVLVAGGLINTAKTKASDHHFLWARFKITKQ